MDIERNYPSAVELAQTDFPLNPITRIRKIHDFAGQLAAGAEPLEEFRPCTVGGLIRLAQLRERYDVAQAELSELTQIAEAATQLHDE